MPKFRVMVRIVVNMLVFMPISESIRHARQLPDELCAEAWLSLVVPIVVRIRDIGGLCFVILPRDIAVFMFCYYLPRDITIPSRKISRRRFQVQNDAQSMMIQGTTPPFTHPLHRLRLRMTPESHTCVESTHKRH